MNGLKLELQAKVKSLELDTLAEIKDRVLILEESNKGWKGGGVNTVEKGLGNNKGPILSKVGPTASKGWVNREGGARDPRGECSREAVLQGRNFPR